MEVIMDNNEEFKKWFKDTFGKEVHFEDGDMTSYIAGYALQAWQHQQKIIDKLRIIL